MVIGVCGGSGSGKSTVTDLLRDRGAYVFDADAVYRKLTSGNTTCMKALVTVFGRSIQNEDGSLKRDVMAKAIFGNSSFQKEMRQTVNSITHHYVKKEYLEWYSTLPTDALVVMDVPLLYESKMNELCDCVIAVIADMDVRIQRITQRDGIDSAAARKRIRSQMTDAKLKKKTPYVLDNSKDLSDLKRELEAMIKTILKG